jgi:hypothetical protein
MKYIIEKWTASKNTNDFNYNESIKTLIKEKSIVNQSIQNYLHFNFSNEAIEEKFKAVENINQKYIDEILELINKYTYYLEMNDILKSQDDENIKKLKQFNKILDDDFVDFLDRYLNLDKTILSSDESLKIETNYQDVIKHYLQYDFKFAINELTKFLNYSPRKDSIKLIDNDLTNSIIIKPATKAYLKPIGERAILKCLYFDLLFNFNDISKEQAINIIKEFFNIVLEDKKTEHTLTAKTIKYIKENKNIFIFDDKTSKIVKKEITEILNIKKYIEDNFIPLYTTYDK